LYEDSDEVYEDCMKKCEDMWSVWRKWWEYMWMKKMKKYMKNLISPSSHHHLILIS